MVAVACFAERLQFLPAVERAIFSREGNVQHPRSHHVLVGRILVKRRDVAVHILSLDLPVGLWQGQYLVPAGFDGSGLVHVDVSGLGSQYAFIRAEQSVDDRGVGLCAPYQEMYGSLGTVAGLPDFLFGTLCVDVAAITGCLFQVCLQETFQDERMRSLHVVAVEM